MSFQTRRDLYASLERKLDSKIVLYVTGDQKQWETQIHPEVLDFFGEHLDSIGKVQKISLILYSRGGNTLAAWSLVNLIRQFCEEFEVVVPSKAHSAATLICLGADNIIMTKQATLGPIDPSVNTPLNPHIPGQPDNITMPVNVEAIKGFIELAKEEIGVKNSSDLAIVMKELMAHVHPLVLGEVYRARSQIKMLAKKLLSAQMHNKKQIEAVTNFLCSDSGSHDYTINRTEARNELGLPIKNPDDELYGLISALFRDFSQELELGHDYDPLGMLGQNMTINYGKKRALIESNNWGSHYFESVGSLTKVVQPNGLFLNDNRISEGWRYEHI